MKSDERCPHCQLDSFAFVYPLWETKYFYIICDAHPLIEGHILIIPKNHLNCLGAFPEKLFQEFLEIYNRVFDFLQSAYGQTATFEHGVFGQTVFHAHVHLLPFKGQIKQIIPEGKSYIKSFIRLNRLISEYETQGGYLFFSLNQKYYLVDKSLTQPRFFRDRFAKALDRPERGDWKKSQKSSRIKELMQRDLANLTDKWKLKFK